MLEYLRLRGVKDSSYLAFVKEGPHTVTPKLCTAAGYDFILDHMLDASSLQGVGLIATNKLLNTEDSSLVAIAVVEGDDVLCIDTKDQSICLWLIQNGNGERIPVANSFIELLRNHVI